MMRRRTRASSQERGNGISGGDASTSISVGNGDSDGITSSTNGYHKTAKNTDAKSKHASAVSTRTALKVYALIGTILTIRSYLAGITAAGNETWYPVPLIGFVRSDLAVACALLGSIPFTFMVVGWTHVGLVSLAALAVYMPQLVMPGPIPIPDQAYACFAFLWTVFAVLVIPSWRKPTAAVVLFCVMAIMLPYLPEGFKPLFSSIPLEHIPGEVVNLRPDIQEEVGAAALESGPLLEFVWKNRNDWVKVSHGRALGYFVFGKNFNHDTNYPLTPFYSLRRGFRLSKYRETWGESDFRLGYPGKRAEVSKMFRETFGTSLATIYSRVLKVDPDTIVLGDMGALAKMENMGFPAVKIVFPSLFWHWFNNPHTDSYLYRMKEIDGNRCDRARQRTFLIPLTEPPGAGLYYWYKNGTRVDVDYKVGNVYSFEVSVLHAIRPFPYFEWKHGMMDSRVTIQAFGIPCGDKWYITH